MPERFIGCDDSTNQKLDDSFAPVERTHSVVRMDIFCEQPRQTRSGFAAVLRACIDNLAICRLHCLQVQDVIHPADPLLAADLLLVHAPPSRHLCLTW
jgi:hypothetical protein